MVPFEEGPLYVLRDGNRLLEPFGVSTSRGTWEELPEQRKCILAIGQHFEKFERLFDGSYVFTRDGNEYTLSGAYLRYSVLPKVSVHDYIAARRFEMQNPLDAITWLLLRRASVFLISRCCGTRQDRELDAEDYMGGMISDEVSVRPQVAMQLATLRAWLEKNSWRRPLRGSDDLAEQSAARRGSKTE